MGKICVFLETREEIYGHFTREPPIFTAKSTPSHDFWPIRLVLHQVYEGPRVLRWPGVVRKLFLKVGSGTNQYNCMDNKYTHAHIYIYIFICIYIIHP